MEYCMYCNNTGRTSKNPFKCENCGREFKRLPLDIVSTETFIPKKYKSSLWDVRVLRHSYSKKYKLEEEIKATDSWLNILNSLLESLKSGIIPPESFYIAAPKDNSKFRWVYTSILYAETSGFSSNDFIDLVDLNIEMDNIKYCDWLVIRVTDFKIKENIEKLNYLLPFRASKDLGTIIVSTIPYDALMAKAGITDIEVDNIAQNFI